MSDQSRIDTSVEVKWHDDGRDITVLGATTVRIAVSGAVTVAAKDYEWKGVTTAKEAEQVALLARWDFGRTLNFEVGRPERSVIGRLTAGGWQTVVTWSPDDFPAITVTLDGFTSLEEGATQARAAVDAVVAQLVPDGDRDERIKLRDSINLPAGGRWAESLFRLATQYP